MQDIDKKSTVLTGDRPTGSLHLGLYIGSIKQRVYLQEIHDQFVIIADMQALTDNAGNPKMVAGNVLEVLRDYIACGIDPDRTTIFLQSAVPALSDLTVLFMNLVTVARLERNPTVKSEIQSRGFQRDIPVGFLAYPVSQAADITAFQATLIPVGDDQLPMIEQTNEVVRAVNRIAGAHVLRECKPLLSNTSRLPGIDGLAKMSKSLNNGISLSDDYESIKMKVKMMYTDPNHLKVSDRGTVEGNIVFTYLDAFGPDKAEVERMKQHYRRGGLGDTIIKSHLTEILEEIIGPIRERRKALASKDEYLLDILAAGNNRANSIAKETLSGVREGLGVFDMTYHREDAVIP